MLECLIASKGTVIVLTILLILSEALGETKVVKSNGVLHFIVELVEAILRVIKKIIHR